MWGLCSWIVFGFIAGLVARAIMPGRQHMGFIQTTLLGVAGSFVGGFLAAFLRGGNWRTPSTTGFIGAVIGAIVLLVVAELISNRRR